MAYWKRQSSSTVGRTPAGVYTRRKIGLKPKGCSSIAQSSTVASGYSAFNFSNRRGEFFSISLVQLEWQTIEALVGEFVIYISLTVNIPLPCANQLDGQKISVNQSPTLRPFHNPQSSASSWRAISSWTGLSSERNIFGPGCLWRRSTSSFFALPIVATCHLRICPLV